MSTDARDRDGEARSALALRLAVDCVIFEAMDDSPECVILALAEVVERCRAEGRYPIEDIEAAAAQLCQELGLPRRTS